MAWECPQLTSYWTAIFHTIYAMIGTDMFPDPTIELLGYVKDTPVTFRKLHPPFAAVCYATGGYSLGQKRHTHCEGLGSGRHIWAYTTDYILGADAVGV